MKLRIIIVGLAVLLTGLCACAGPQSPGSTAAAELSYAPEQETAEAAAQTEAVPAETDGELLPDPVFSPESSSAPEATVYVPRTFTEADYNIYLTGSGTPDPHRISVEFIPGALRDGKPDPDIRVWNSFAIRNEAEIRAICTRILADPLYDQAVYGRTLESMVTEWLAHSDINAVYSNERTRHVDLDRDDEGVRYADFWQRALREFRQQ